MNRRIKIKDGWRGRGCEGRGTKCGAGGDERANGA